MKQVIGQLSNLYFISKRPASFLHYLAAGGQTPPPIAECPANNVIFFWRASLLALYWMFSLSGRAVIGWNLITNVRSISEHMLLLFSAMSTFFPFFFGVGRFFYCFYFYYVLSLLCTIYIYMYTFPMVQLHKV